jgi:cytochrome c oxidase subunit 2
VRVYARAVWWTCGLLLTALLVSSCGIGGLSPIFPSPVSPNGQDIYNTYIGISIPAIVVFIGVEAAILWVVLRYRRSKQPAGYVPPQVHGNTRLEIIWTIVPLVLVLAIAAYSFAELQNDFQQVTNKCSGSPSGATADTRCYDLQVVVSGHQFGWDYTYPENFTVHQEGTLAGDVTPFVVPVHKLVKLDFRSDNVIHSWWVPAISGKTDAVPGYDNYAWLQIDQVGTWRGQCTELCGVGHATMQIIVKAVSQSDYDQWVQQQLAANATASPSPS